MHGFYHGILIGFPIGLLIIYFLELRHPPPRIAMRGVCSNSNSNSKPERDPRCTECEDGYRNILCQVHGDHNEPS